MKEQLEANQREMDEMSKSWEQKLIEAKAREEARDRDANRLLHAERGELERMMAERLAKSLSR